MTRIRNGSIPTDRPTDRSPTDRSPTDRSPADRSPTDPPAGRRRLVTDVHERAVPADPADLWALVADLGSPRDRLWPSESWVPLRFDGFVPGTTGRHGLVRHTCVDVVPGRSIELAFACAGITGRHRFLVLAGDDPGAAQDGSHGATRLRHELEADMGPAQRLFWRVAILPSHSAIIEDLFDNAVYVATGTGAPAARRSLATRWLSKAEDRWMNRRTRDTERVGPTHTRRRAATIGAAGGLLGAAAMHAHWAAGGTWPGTDAADLARKVIGSADAMPAPAAAWAVAAALVSAAGLVLARPRSRNRLVVNGTRTVAIVLALRAVGGFATSGWQRGGSPYAVRDLLVYSPLCAALAVLIASGARPPTVEPQAPGAASAPGAAADPGAPEFGTGRIRVAG